MILKLLAAVFTGIGGHYLNRRWDKAILFLCLFFGYTLIVYGLMNFYLLSSRVMTAPSDTVMEKVGEIVQLTTTVFVSGILFIWAVSLIVTILDNKNNVEPTISRWTRSGIVGASITSILSFILLISTVVTIFSISVNNVSYTSSTSGDRELSSFDLHNFYEYMYFGMTPSNSRKLPDPPKGDGFLRGKITYQGDPAVGVTLSIVLNSKYRVKEIITDESGIFSVQLPTGTWVINSIQTKSWLEKPKVGEYTIYSGEEERLKGNKYNRHGSYRKEGYSVNVSAEPDVIHFNASISKDINLIWPDPSAKGIDSTIDDLISWEEYPNASQYYVEIKKLTRDGDTTSYDEVASRILSDETTLPLSSLKYIKTGNEEKIEYAAEIYAFSADGTLIAETSETYRGGTFLLSKGTVLIDEGNDDFFNLSSKDPETYVKEMEAIALNKRRNKAVKVLIDDRMLEEAALLVNLMDSEYSKGNKEALSGYILALQGKCKKSKEMFDQASSINPKVCITDKYKATCK